MQLRPFSPDATCRKCGHDQISVRWKLLPAGHVSLYNESQWLVRTCDRCEYKWDEACLDMEEA